MAIYKQYRIGNFKLYVFDSKVYNDDRNIDKYVLLRGSDIRRSIREYVRYFMDKYHDEIYDYNSYTEEPKFINNFLYDSDGVRAEISENEINNNFWDVIIDENTNSKLWVYNGNNVKIAGWAKRDLGQNGPLLLRNFTLYVYIYYKDGNVYKCFGVPYQVTIGGYYNPDTPEQWARELDNLYAFNDSNWSYFAAIGSIYYANDPNKLELSFVWQNANPSPNAQQFWFGITRIQTGWLVLTYDRFLSNPIQPNIQNFKLNSDNTIPPGIDVSIDTLDPDNPYSGGSTSTTGGGNGTFDNKSDPVEFSQLPTLTALNSGFVGLYAPTLSQLRGLSNYLWNDSFNLDQLKKLFADPMDLLLSLTIVPLSPPITVQEDIKVGFISTGLPMNKVEQQFITYDLGSLEIKPYFDSALDYSPFTKISIYLPYIGLRQLNVDEIMGKTIHLQYNIDLFTGSCVAEIRVISNDLHFGAVLYTFNGNVACSIPLTAGSFSNFLSASMSVAANIGLAVATGGATGAKSIASSAANLIASAKPNVEHTGSISSTAGYLSNKTPYLIYEIPKQSIAESYQNYVGFPSNITSKLSDLSGYTEIESIHLENIPATMNELTEIESLLKQGVIL